MLALNLKHTNIVSLESQLKGHLPKDWAGGASFLAELDQWRKRFTTTSYSKQGAEECRDAALQYYQRVAHATEHFSHKSLKLIGVYFKWQDTFQASGAVSLPEWSWERANALFNAVAAMSFMATSEDRGEAAGMKRACNYFQQAAGTVQQLLTEAKAGAWVDRTPDLSVEFLEALEHLFLAQAQKCFYEKAVADGKPDAICAKLAAECAALYEEHSIA